MVGMTYCPVRRFNLGRGDNTDVEEVTGDYQSFFLESLTLIAGEVQWT
jgi:hypothetical protein